MGSVIVLPCLASACDRHPEPDSDVPASTRSREVRATAPLEIQRELEQLQAEAGIESATDPPPPTGDLGNEIESFTTLDACVRSHAMRDPLIGDAIDALGYDTLIRDACRILQALKAKSAAPCKRILASPLRAKCESSVATLIGDLGLCPVVGEASKLGARDPVCIARASRDERLCAAASVNERATCRALILGRVAECVGNTACIRQLERYRTLSGNPDAHTPLKMRLHIELAAGEGTPDAPARSFDLEDIAAGGALVRESEHKIHVALGAPKTALWAAPEGAIGAPKLFLEVSVSIGSSRRRATAPEPPTPEAPNNGPRGHELAPADLRFDLLLPGVGLFSGVSARESKLESADVPTEIGSPISLVVTTRLHDGTRDYRVRIEVETFVKDRIARAGKWTP